MFLALHPNNITEPSAPRACDISNLSNYISTAVTKIFCVQSLFNL